MRSRHLLSFAAVLALGGVAATGAVRCVAVAATAENAKKAASDAFAARKALATRKADQAVALAEQAVANDPQRAEYRALLGQAYLLAGRFTAAGQALRDALSLDPHQPRAALNLVLASIATGDWGGARALLETHADRIPPTDRGLAYALAGDPETAVQILADAVRSPEASARTRQNLAFVLALAGRWGEAKAVAAMDVAPDQLNRRLQQWAAMARPANAYDQVSALLGVRPVADSGQPAALALVAPPAPAPLVAAAAPAPVNPPEPEQVAEAPVAPPSPEPTPVFAPRREQTRPQVPVRVAAMAPAKVAPVRKTGSYVVQLGAFANAAVARDAWTRLAGRVAPLGRLKPQGASVASGKASLYRLSVGGFAREDADGLCRAVRGGGGTCFVRMAAGDAVASWYKPGVRVAAR